MLQELNNSVRNLEDPQLDQLQCVITAANITEAARILHGHHQTIFGVKLLTQQKALVWHFIWIMISCPPHTHC